MKYFSPLSSLILIILLPSPVLSSDLHTFLKTNNCIKCDLSFSDLNYSIFKNGDLAGSDLSYLNASRSNFFNYSFRTTNLSRANFTHARLISSDFTGAIFDNTVFFETVVTDSIFNYETVPSHIIINSIDFPIHLLPNNRVNKLLSIASPDTHPRFYLSLLEHLKSLSPSDPSASLLLAHFYYKYQLDIELSLLALEEASSQFLALNQPEKSLKIRELSQLLSLELEKQSTLEMPDSASRGDNGLGISVVSGIKNLFSNLLPTITSLSSLIR